MHLNVAGGLQTHLHAFLERSRRPFRTKPSWTEDVGCVIASLEDLNRSTESGFLAVGGNLMAFLSASRKLHSDIVALTALVSVEQAQKACDALVSVRCHVQELQRRGAEDSRALMTVQAGADRIRRGFSAFAKIVLSFRITAIAARIEVAHLAASRQNLDNLGDDVGSCSDGMRERAARILDVATVFDSRVASTLREVSRFEVMQAQELPLLLAAVDADADAFQVRQREAVKGSLKLAADLSSVTGELGDVAMSIQFHDITRQQVEHVIGALQGLLRNRAKSTISSSGAALAGLQSAQLRSAAAAFANSTKKIDRDLECIALRVGEMATAGNRLDGLDRSEHGTFLSRMQQSFAAVARAVSELDSFGRDTRAIAADLLCAGQCLGEAVAEVQSIELQLTHISINAVVSASHMGSQGEALNMIANSIRDLKEESASCSGDAVETLQSIGKAIVSLSGTGVSAANDVSGATLIQVLNSCVGELRSASVSGARAAANVAVLAANLCAGLQSARENFQIGRVFAETAVRCCDLLDGVACQAKQLLIYGASSAPDTTCDSYTMQAERDVHLAVASGTPLDNGEGVPPDLSPESGQDVEFF